MHSTYLGFLFFFLIFIVAICKIIIYFKVELFDDVICANSDSSELSCIDHKSTSITLFASFAFFSFKYHFVCLPIFSFLEYINEQLNKLQQMNQKRKFSVYNSRQCNKSCCRSHILFGILLLLFISLLSPDSRAYLVVQ